MDFNPLDPLGIFDKGATVKPQGNFNNEIKRQAIIASLQMALPDEDKASKDYGLLAQHMRDTGRDEFARQLESIANQEAGHFVSIGYMLQQLKKG